MTSRPTEPARLAGLPDRLAGTAAKAPAPTGLQPCDTRRSAHVPGRQAMIYGLDRSRSVEYRFNSAGYRSEEYNAQAPFRLCIAGESHAFGNGVAFEDSFGYRLKCLLATTLGLPLDAVNLVNLAIGGASSDYCARTLFRQVPGLMPDLVVCVVPYIDRIEYQGADGFNNLLVSSVDTDELDKLPPALLGYCEYYDTMVGRLNQLKNMLLIQGFLRGLDTEYIFVANADNNPAAPVNPLPPFLAQLDRDKILGNLLFRKRPDLAADKVHAGPRTHAAMAILLLDHFGGLLRARGLADLADRVETRALDLMRDDADYRFCSTALGREVTAP